MKDRDAAFAKYLRKISRESELEERSEKGGPIFRSKSWDSIPSHKTTRRKFKQVASQFLDNPEDFEE
jgi:hypothetical protein